MSATRRWESLSARTRASYVSAAAKGKGGLVLDEAGARDYYERGGDLRYWRRHATSPEHPGRAVPLRRSWAAPSRPTQLEALGANDDAGTTQLKNWRKSNLGPKWIPASTPTDVAAILSQIHYEPRWWRTVTITPITGTGRYRMTIEMKGNRYPDVIILPDWNATSEVATVLNDNARLMAAKSPRERRRLEKEWSTPGGRALHIGVTIQGTDPKAMAPVTGPLKKANGKGLKRKKRQ